MTSACRLLLALAAVVPCATSQTRDLTIRKVGPAATADFEKHVKVALICGVANYPEGSGLGSLKYSVRDAETLGAALKAQGYLVRLLTDSQATRSMIRHTIKEMGDAVEPNEGTFLFFFGGHGFAAKGQNYLATYGVTADDLEGDGLAVADVETLLASSKAKRKLVFVDACRNDPGNGTRAIEQRSFAKLNAAEGLKVMFSTKEGHVSYEDDKLKQGVFTYFLVKALNGEAAGPDGLVTFHDMSDYLTDKMRAFTVERGEVQVPFEAGEASGDFLLAKATSAAPAAPTPASVRAIAPPAPKPALKPPASGDVAVNPKDGLKYAFIPAGSFTMGCSPGDDLCVPSERPPHQEKITSGFWIGQLETTTAAYQKFAAATKRDMPPDPRIFSENWNPGWKIGNLPISNVSFQTASAYCEWAGLRLPAEPEWEYAARGGTTQAHYGRLDEIAWFARNSGKQKPDIPAILKEGPNLLLRRLIENGASPKPGGLKQPNAYGLFDMLGNVREWTAGEWTGGSTSDDANSEDSNSIGKQRVTRGGSFSMLASHVRASSRGHMVESERNASTGFRCAGDPTSMAAVK